MDPAYPPDGDNLLPILSGRASPHPRKLFWRFKAGGQRAVRDGDWKYLQIAGNEFLFDVVKDPRERANLKDRYKDVFDRLKSDWAAWNDTMLAERPRPAPYSNPGNVVADHYGVVNPPPAAPPGAPRSDDRLVADDGVLPVWGVRAARRSGQAWTIRPPGASHSWTQ